MNSLGTGLRGEDLALDYLKAKGFKILERNFWTKFGELDLVCRKGGLIVFVEVKAMIGSQWSGFDPEQHFTKQKSARLKRAIEIYLINNKISEEAERRLDLVAIELDENADLKDLRHYENVS